MTKLEDLVNNYKSKKGLYVTPLTDQDKIELGEELAIIRLDIRNELEDEAFKIAKQLVGRTDPADAIEDILNGMLYILLDDRLYKNQQSIQQA